MKELLNARPEYINQKCTLNNNVVQEMDVIGGTGNGCNWWQLGQHNVYTRVFKK